MNKPVILKAAELPAATVDKLKTLFTVLDLPQDKADIMPFLHKHGTGVRGMALRKTIVDQAVLKALPDLEIISSYSAGLDNVDVPAVRERGIIIENTSRILAEDVANTAIGLVLAATKDIVNADSFVRNGRWPDETYPLQRSIVGMQVGIVGFGTIGAAIARRLQAMGSKVAYSGLNRKPVDLPYYTDPKALAKVCDMLIMTCPLTEHTRHLIDSDVLDALGPRGYIINISRGPVIDETALLSALADNRIKGAGLDVFEHEPAVPEALIRDPRVVLTPHIGSGTHETRQAMADNVVDALARHFAVQVPHR